MKKILSKPPKKPVHKYNPDEIEQWSYFDLWHVWTTYRQALGLLRELQVCMAERADLMRCKRAVKSGSSEHNLKDIKGKYAELMRKIRAIEYRFLGGLRVNTQSEDRIKRILRQVESEVHRRGLKPLISPDDFSLEMYLNPANFVYPKKSPGRRQSAFTIEVLSLKRKHPALNNRKIAMKLVKNPSFIRGIKKLSYSDQVSKLESRV